MPQIISASRRSDIPAFYSRWLLRRLEEGSCEWLHPFTGKLQRVSLRPEDVLALVLWTRNPEPVFPALEGLRVQGHHLYFHFTITGYPKVLESHNPPLQKSLARARELARRLGPEALGWRYDPILLSSATPAAYHLERFALIAKALEGSTQRCTFSFVDLYGKTRRNLERLQQQEDLEVFEPELDERRELAAKLSDLAAAHGMQLYSCCEKDLVGEGIQRSRCVDPELISALRGEAELPSPCPPRPTRQDCGCVASVDIGAYDTCLFGCVYCYATNSRQAAAQRAAGHDAEDSLLWRPDSRPDSRPAPA